MSLNGQLNRQERSGDLYQTVLAALLGFQKGLWTAMPGIIQTFDAAAVTCVVQPALQGLQLQPDGNSVWVNMPLLLDVPVVFPRGGGFTLTFPIAAGDEVLVVFASRCIDDWWTASGFANKQAELRMHDLSDGFAIPGPFSQVTKISGISTTSVQLRSNDGAAYVEIASGHVINVVADVVNVTAPNVNVVASAELKVTSPLTRFEGELETTGYLTIRKGHPEELSMATFVSDYNTHTHSGVTVGGGHTGAPDVILP